MHISAAGSHQNGKKMPPEAPRRHQATHQASQPASRPQNEPKNGKKEDILGCCFSLFGYCLIGSRMVFFEDSIQKVTISVPNLVHGGPTHYCSGNLCKCQGHVVILKQLLTSSLNCLPISPLLVHGHRSHPLF